MADLSMEKQEENIELNYDKVCEGKAQVFFPKTKNQEVFYNPVQHFNRDLSIAAINTYSFLNKQKRLNILEALAASGIRSIRYALEIENCTQIIANDFDKKAVELIDLNTKANNVSHIIKSNFDDAIVLMNRTSVKKNDHFDVIDLDPYGSPAVFLDSAIRTIKSGGLLLVTATDAGVLCGNGADTCYTKYGAMSIRTPCCHEMALRILLQSINSHAIRYSKYIVPIMSLSIDFYFRLFILVFDGQMKAKESINNIGTFNICSGCNSFFQQDFGITIPTHQNVKFIHNTDFIDSKCINCDGKLKSTGPVWTGKLHDESFIQHLIEHVNLKTKSDYLTRDRILGMLNLALEELPNPLYYVLDQLCAVMHCQSPNHNVFRSALLNSNYQVSYSHCNKNSIKTNAPSEFIWKIMKEWVKLNPINSKWLTNEFKVFNILNKDKPNETEIKIDFTIREDSLPNSKKNKLVRYHEPPPYWGPKAKPKRKAEEEKRETEKEKLLKNSDNSNK